VLGHLGCQFNPLVEDMFDYLVDWKVLTGTSHLAVGREDKGISQFGWWRVKVCLLSLHIIGQLLPKYLYGSTFCEFWYCRFV
jgi:hypothetical protein